MNTEERIVKFVEAKIQQLKHDNLGLEQKHKRDLFAICPLLYELGMDDLYDKARNIALT